MLIGTRVYRSPWAVAALAAAFTLRHRIPRTSANSLEPYFHPRMLAFGIGMLAVAAVLRRRSWAAVALVAAAAAIHVTTALWFAVLMGMALAVLDARLRRVVIAGAAAAAGVLIAAVAAGPLRGTMTTMDATWLQAVASKDSLFATQWPVWAWAANLALLRPALAGRIAARTRRGDATAEDRALVWGAGALVALFLVTLPLVAAGMSLAVQFQISRVFWLVEFLALVYVIAAICDSQTVHAPTASMVGGWLADSRSRLAAACTSCSSSGPSVRCSRCTCRSHRGRTRWRGCAASRADTHVLADPGHGWKYGTSVRVSAERDVLLEEVKDSALAIYSRDVAARVVERTQAIGDFASLTADRARELGQPLRSGLPGHRSRTAAAGRIPQSAVPDLLTSVAGSASRNRGLTYRTTSLATSSTAHRAPPGAASSVIQTICPMWAAL